MKTSYKVSVLADHGFNSLRLALSLLAVGMLGCATKMRITTVPSDAAVVLKNTVTQETFPLGKGRLEFSPKAEYGSSFAISVSRKGYITRDFMVNPMPGSATDYLINLKADSPKIDGSDNGEKFQAMLDEKFKNLDEKIKAFESDMKSYIAGQLEDAQENMRLADEDRRQALFERVRAEFARRNAESEKKVSVLENTFEVYKDALFSERYASGPAGFDRRRIDNSVDSVNRIQRFIEEKRYAEAESLVDKLLEKDEYFAKGYALKGTVKYLMNKPKESVTAWERAIELDPNDKATQNQLTAAYRLTGQRVPASSRSVTSPAPAKPAAKPPALKVRDK